MEGLYFLPKKVEFSAEDHNPLSSNKERVLIPCNLHLLALCQPTHHAANQRTTFCVKARFSGSGCSMSVNPLNLCEMAAAVACSAKQAATQADRSFIVTDKDQSR